MGLRIKIILLSIVSLFLSRRVLMRAFLRGMKISQLMMDMIPAQNGMGDRRIMRLSPAPSLGSYGILKDSS